MHEAHLRLHVLLVRFEVELRTEDRHLQPVGRDDERTVLVVPDIGKHFARQVDLPDRPVKFFGIDEFGSRVEPHVGTVGQYDLAPLAHIGIDLHPFARGSGLMSVMKSQGYGNDDGCVFGYTQGYPPPPGATPAGGGIRSGAGGKDRIQFAAYALLSLGVVFDLGGIQQVAEHLVHSGVFQPLPQPHAYLLRLGFRTFILHVAQQQFTRYIFLGIHRVSSFFRRISRKTASRRRLSFESA